MKGLRVYIILCLLLTACKQRDIQKPDWLNKSDLIIYPGFLLEFKTEAKYWNATLLTFTQPITLSCNYRNKKLFIFPKTLTGITEGPGQICLSNGKRSFYYPVTIKNIKLLPICHKDYRCPKTINPDSSLHQQRIVHNIDTFRNLVPVNTNKSFFFEEEISMAPKKGVYRAVKTEPLSSFYLQAGSCTDVPVKVTFRKELNSHQVTVGPLKDKHNNTVSDGTLIEYIYSNEFQTCKIEATLLNGFSTIFISSEKNKKYLLKVKVNETFSSSINLSEE